MSSKTKLFRVTSLLEFDLIKKGRFFKTESMWFKYYINTTDKDIPLKLSVAVSKKYGNAVKRNLFTRRVKSSFYNCGKTNKLPNNILLLVGVDRNYENEVPFSEIEISIQKFLRHINKNNTNVERVNNNGV